MQKTDNENDVWALMLDLIEARGALLQPRSDLSITCNGVTIPMSPTLFERVWEAAHDELTNEIADLSRDLLTPERLTYLRQSNAKA